MNHRIIHAERDFRFHEKLKAAFARYPDFHFVDHCCYLDSGLQLLKAHQPEILITASKLYDEPNVVEAFCNYRDVYSPSLKIVVLTSKEDMDHFLNSVVCGVDAYLAKGKTTEEIIHVLHTTIDGNHYLSVAQGMIQHK